MPENTMKYVYEVCGYPVRDWGENLRIVSLGLYSTEQKANEVCNEVKKFRMKYDKVFVTKREVN